MGLTVAGLLLAALSGAPLIIPSVANEINFDHTIKRHRYDRPPEGILKTFLKQGQCFAAAGACVQHTDLLLIHDCQIPTKKNGQT